MSTISLGNERQIRHFFVADAIATETTPSTFRSKVQIFDANGGVLTSVSAAGTTDFYVAKLNQKGTVSKSDFITPGDITYLNGTSPQSKVGKIQSFTAASAPTAGAEYRLVAKVNYAQSEENFITFVSGYQVSTGDTIDDVFEGLADQMCANLALSVNTSTSASGTDTVGTIEVSKNKYFTFSLTGSVLSIQEKDWILDDFRVGLKSNDQLMWNFEIQGEEADDNITKDETPGTFAKGQGYQMMELERYLVGHRAEFEGRTTTLSFGRDYDTNTGTEYYVVDLKYFDISRDSAKHSDKMITVVSSDLTTINEIAGIFAAQSGIAFTDLT